MPSLLAVVSGIFRKTKLVRPTIVALLEGPDCALVWDICRRGYWDVSFANSRSEALLLMHRVQAQILFIDRDLAGSDWRQTMSAFASSSVKTCIVLVSRVVDVYLWNEVVRNGGYDVLAKPLREKDVSKTVKLAWSYWSSGAKSPSSKTVAKI